MKVSVAVLSCLMLVTALGSQAQVTNDAETGFMMSKLSLANPEVPDKAAPLAQKVLSDACRCLQMPSLSGRNALGPAVAHPEHPQTHGSTLALTLLMLTACTSYIPGRIPCSLLESYLETSSKCSKPGVIFLTKNGRRLCVSPSNKQVLACRIMLKLATQIKARKN
ncbi:hypothetical protein H8959_002182 [Pygathrix nigripes]